MQWYTFLGVVLNVMHWIHTSNGLISKGRYKRSSEHYETTFQTIKGNATWPHREQVAEIPGQVMLGGLMMVHERDDKMICGKIMPQGGIQATEVMLYTIEKVNEMDIIPGVTLGARIKDDCDRDIYGLEQAVDFIRGMIINILHY